MSRLLKIVGVCCLCLAFPAVAAAAPPGGVDVLLGFRSFDGGEWGALEDQPVAGVNLGLGARGWPVEVQMGLFFSYDKETVVRNDVTVPEVELTTAEFSLGVRRTWEDLFINARPFFGGGVTVIRADFDVTLFGNHATDSDTSLGLFLNGGYFWELGETFELGFEGRVVLGTDITLGENNKTITGSGFRPDNVDYAQLSALLGWSW